MFGMNGHIQNMETCRVYENNLVDRGIGAGSRSPKNNTFHLSLQKSIRQVVGLSLQNEGENKQPIQPSILKKTTTNSNPQSLKMGELISGHPWKSLAETRWLLSARWRGEIYSRKVQRSSWCHDELWSRVDSQCWDVVDGDVVAAWCLVEIF